MRGGDIVENAAGDRRTVVAYDSSDQTVTFCGETRWVDARRWVIVGAWKLPQIGVTVDHG